MTVQDAFMPANLQTRQIRERAAVLMLAVASSLLAGFRLRSPLVLAAALLLCTFAIPAIVLLLKRLKIAGQQAEVEHGLMRQTRDFLSRQEPQVWPEKKPPEPDPEALGERLLAVLKTDGRSLPRQRHRYTVLEPQPLPAGAPVVYSPAPVVCDVFVPRCPRTVL